MSSAQIKYNPGIRGDAELVRSFVVRKVELELALETLRENAESQTSSNQHILFVGPRGIGKTMLVRRVAAEVRAVPALAAAWYPIVFAEDAYMVSSPGEFWLEALFHLGEQTGDECWAQAYEGLKAEADEVRLRERALAHLLDFADRKGSRILLIVENLNRLLGEQIQGHSHWDLRHTLQNERRIMLLGTATTRFEEIENIDKAWFEMFAIHDLKPLDHKDCMEVWRAVTGSEPHAQRVRAVQILTGGNPRLLTILAEFAAKRSFRELMDQLIQLVDDHTEYFKSHLDNLPPSERKVFVTLLDRWDATGARQVAQAARMGVNNVSVQLNRLVGRGAVEIVQQDGRRKLYQATERLYNIYYLMRRRAHPSVRVQVVVHFMVHFYEAEELVEMTADLAREACVLAAEERQDLYLTYEGILRHRACQPDLRWRILEATPNAFFEATDAPETLRELPRLLHRDIPARARVAELVERGDHLLEQRHFQEAEQAYRDALAASPRDAKPWLQLGWLLTGRLGRPEEAEQAYRKAIELKSDYARAWGYLGQLLHEKLGRPEEAEQAYRQAIEIDRGVAWTWAQLGLLLHQKLGRPKEAEQAYRKAVELQPDYHWAWEQLGHLLHQKLGRYEEAEQATRKAIGLVPDCPCAWDQLGRVLHEKLGRYEEAEGAYRKAIEVDPEYAWAWGHLGQLLHQKLGRPEEAEQAYRKALGLRPDDDWLWVQLGRVLHQELGRADEAEQAYRKAIELGPDHAWAWRHLGVVLHEKLKRYEEAEQAYRKALELAPCVGPVWTKLGQLLHEKLGRHEEAEQAYRKAIELEPDHACPWAYLGQLLHEKFGRHEEGEEAYRRAVKLTAPRSIFWPLLVKFRLDRGDDSDLVIHEAQGLLERGEGDAESLSRIALVFYEYAPASCLPQAELWAREAVEKDRDWKHVRALVSILGRQGKWEEALEQAGPLLDATATDWDAGRQATQFIIDAAAASRGQRALQALTASAGAVALEPLSVGLRIFLGEKPLVAQEIFEIGQDVAQRIRERQAARSK